MLGAGHTTRCRTVTQLRVRVQIDLRSFTERQEDAGAALLTGAEVMATAALGKFEEVRSRGRAHPARIVKNESLLRCGTNRRPAPQLAA